MTQKIRYRIDLIKATYVEAESVDDVIEQMKKWEEAGTFNSEEWTEIYIDEDDSDVTMGYGDSLITVDVIPNKNELN